MPEVVEVVATLRVLADHKAGPAAVRLLTGARWRVGLRDLDALRRWAVHLANPSGEPDPEAEPATLLEALDDPGPADRYSPDGFARITALGSELRYLRTRLSAPLHELVAEVERRIGVDIEVGARPHRGVGRTHLDRFLDEAARFAAEADQATLTAFLAFLEAAEDEEHGLDAGEAVVADERVQLLTVHGAKGLEWDLVALPGLVADVFPAPPKGVDWVTMRHLLPSPLRGDRDDLPVFDAFGAGSRGEIGDRMKQHKGEVDVRHQREERRLAYVAVTRARSVLLASGFVWGDTAKTARVASPFLDEIGAHGAVLEWFEPEDGAVNPLTTEPKSALWPVDPLGGRRAAVEAGAALVRAAAVAGESGAAAPLPGLFGDASERTAAWSAEVDQLLREFRARRDVAEIEVVLPEHLSVSQLVTLRRDSSELARQLQRPLPARPAPLARRGTAFHLWLEQWWGQQSLLDVDELPGAADAGVGAGADADFEALRTAFEASAWAGRQPAEVEVPFEMVVGGRVVRGRMDAVFAGRWDDAGRHDPDGWTVVDWKTGARPAGAEAEAAAVQLAVYRLAWARLLRLDDADLARVSAAFHYVRSSETVTPADLLDAERLRTLVAGG